MAAYQQGRLLLAQGKADEAILRDAEPYLIDMSARDPLRYGGSQPMVDSEGRLLPEWEQFVLTYRQRIMIGSDPFYREDNLYWDEPNTGWDHIDAFIDFHRTWLSFLPSDVARDISIDNAKRFLGIDQ